MYLKTSKYKYKSLKHPHPEYKERIFQHSNNKIVNCCDYCLIAERFLDFTLKGKLSEIFCPFLAPTSNMSCSMKTWATNATTIAGSPIGWYGSGSASLRYPYDVFVYNNSTIYVLDSLNYRVQRFTLNSTIGTTVVSSSAGTALNQVFSSNCTI